MGGPQGSSCEAKQSAHWQGSSQRSLQGCLNELFGYLNISSSKQRALRIADSSP